MEECECGYYRCLYNPDLGLRTRISKGGSWADQDKLDPMMCGLRRVRELRHKGWRV